MNIPMKGIFTWLGVAGLILQGLYQLNEGHTDAAMKVFAEALGFFGVGRKAEKILFSLKHGTIDPKP